MNGFSIMFVVGKPAWPRIQYLHHVLRIVVGPFAVWIFLRDMDQWIVEVSRGLR